MGLQGLLSPAARHSGIGRSPLGALNENLLIAAVVALAIRTFFFQPCWIPTASMEPTLFGIRAKDLRTEPGNLVRTGWRRWWERWARGMSCYHIIAETDGWLDVVQRDRFMVGDTWYPVPAAWPGFWDAAPIDRQRLYHRGEDLVRLRLTAGDRILIDRFSYNFRRPRRGEIVVFSTAGLRTATADLPAVPEDQYYTKRLVSLPREQVRIAADRHLVVNGVRLDPGTLHFSAIYSFDPTRPPKAGMYSGHLNAAAAKPFLKPDQPNPAPLFPDADATFTVRPGHLLVFGDNAVESLDGRAWGDLPERNVLGRCSFVYWPVSARFLQPTP